MNKSFRSVPFVRSFALTSTPFFDLIHAADIYGHGLRYLDTRARLRASCRTTRTALCSPQSAEEGQQADIPTAARAGAGGNIARAERNRPYACDSYDNTYVQSIYPRECREICRGFITSSRHRAMLLTVSAKT